MRYRILPFGRSEPPLSVYVIPVSADRLEYRILYPRVRDSLLMRRLAAGAVEIRSFAGVTGEARERVAEWLDERVRSRSSRRENATVGMIVGGAAVGVLGLVNWFIPDPLPAVDEVVLMVSGGLLALFGLRRRARDALLEDSVRDAARAAIEVLPCTDDEVLSRVFASLRSLEGGEEGPSEAGPAGTEGMGTDAIEQGIRWLVDYGDLEAAAEEGKVTAEEVRKLFGALAGLIPFRRLERLEARGVLARGRGRRLLRRLRDRHGFTEHAVMVYSEFRRSARRMPGG